MERDLGKLRPRMIEAVGKRIYGECWLAQLASLVGVREGAVATKDYRAGSLGILTPAAEAALVLRLVLAEMEREVLGPADVRDLDAFAAALTRALRIEQRSSRLRDGPEGTVSRALLRALAATRLTGKEADMLLTAARPGPVPERELRPAIAGCPSVHAAAEAIVTAWNTRVAQRAADFWRSGGCLYHEALEQVGSADLLPLPEVAERLSWFGGALDILFRCETEDAFRWSYERLADGAPPAKVNAELECHDALPGGAG